MRWVQLFLAILVFSIGAATAQTNTSKAKVQKQRQATTQKLKQSSRQFEQNKQQAARTLRELTLVEADIRQIEKSIAAHKNTIDSITTATKLVTDTITDLNNRLTDLSTKYASALKKRQGSFKNAGTLSYLFASKDVSAAMRKYRALKQFAKWRARKAGEIQNLKDRLAIKQQHLNKLKEQQAKVIASLDQQKAELDESRKKNNDIVAQLRKKNKELQAVIDDSRKEIKLLDEQLEKIIAEEQARIEEQRRREEEQRREEERRLAEEQRLAEEARMAKKAEEQRLADENARKEEERRKKEDKKNKKENKKPKKEKEKHKKAAPTKADSKPSASTPSAATNQPELTARNGLQLTQGFLSAKGNLPYPVDGKHIVVRPFGRQKHPDLPMIETDNPGIDISVNNGETARAIYEGVVSAIFRQPGYNNVVMIRHGDYLTIYANLTDISVKKDQRVAPGQAIGKIAVDDDDVKRRSILHFEIRHEKAKENPELWLK